MMKRSFKRSLLIASVLAFMLLGSLHAEGEGESGTHGGTDGKGYIHGEKNIVFHNEEIKDNSPNKTLYYRYQAGSDWNPAKQHFTAVVHSEHGLSHFDVYISKTSQKPGPNDTAEVTKKCQSWGHDVCFWPKDDIKAHDVITVAVHCWWHCKYTLELQVAEEYVLENNITHRTAIHFGDSSVKIVKLHYKKDATPNPSHIIIHVNPLNAYLFENKYEVYVNKGTEIPDDKTHDVTVADSFGHSKAAIIWNDKKPDSKFCQDDCWYTIAIQAAAGAIFEVRVEIRGDLIPITDHAFGAIVNANDTQIFKFEPSKIQKYRDSFNEIKKQDLFIDVHSFAGAPNVYIHPNTQPAKLTDYKWKFIYNIHDMITLTQMDRAQGLALDQVYYIAITASTPSTFSLNIHYGKNDAHDVRFGVVERGSLQPTEIVNYHLDVFVKGTMDFHITMSKLGGNASMIMKQCPRPFNKTTCNVNMADITKVQERKVTQADKMWSTTHSGRFETINHIVREAECEVDKTHDLAGHLQKEMPGRQVGHCIFVIAVHAPQTPTGRQPIPSPFAFVAYHKDTIHALHEGQPYHHSLEQYHEHLYSFTLPYDASVTNVSFHLTPITGNPNLYISRNTKNPDKNNREKTCSWLNDRAVFGKADDTRDHKLTKVTYYLKAVAESEHSYYSISVIVHRTGQNFANHTHIVLREGVPFKYTMYHYDSEAFFKFNYYPKSPKGTLTVHINAIHGHFELGLADASKLVDEFESTHDTISNELHVDTKPDTKMATYIVRVRSIDPHTHHHHAHNTSRENHTESTHPQFSIFWRSDETFTLIAEKHPHTGSIKANEWQYYQVQVDPKDEAVYINKHVSHGIADVSFSYSGNNIGPGQRPDAEVKGNIQTLALSKAELTKICQDQQPLHATKIKSYCYVWIGVHNPRAYAAHYTLTVSKQGTFNFLTNGVPTPHNYPIGNARMHEIHRYIMFAGHAANTSEPITITTAGDKRGLQILVNIFSWDPKTDLPDDKVKEKFPTNASNHHHSNASCWASYQQVIVPGDQINKTCVKGQYCFLLIVVLRDPKCSIPDEGHHKYTITASSLIEKLAEGHSAHGKLGHRQHKYYSFHNPHKSTDILISSSTTLGMIGLFVSHHKTNSKIRPTTSLYDWGSLRYENSMVEIGPEDIKDGSGSLEGEYIIMVFCYSQNCTYSLSVFYEQQKVGQFYVGKMYDVATKKNSHLYYFLDTWGNQVHDLILTKNYGNATVYVKLWNAHIDTELQVPKKGQADFTIDLQTASYNVTKLTHNKQSCYHCKWVIGFEFAVGGGSITVIPKDITEFHPTTLQAGKSFVDESGSGGSLYKFDLWTGNILHLDVNVIAGNPTVYIGKYQPPNNTVLRKENIKQMTLNGGKRINLTTTFEEATWKCDENHYWCPKERFVFIQVDGPAIYRIRASNELTIISLSDGRIETFHNQAGQHSKFKFVSPYNTAKNKKFHLTVKVTRPFNIKMSDVDVHVYFSPSIAGGDERNKREALIERNGTNIATREIFRQIHAEDGVFLVEVYNRHRNETLDFQIMYSSGELNHLTPHDSHTSFVEIGDFETYEIHGNETGWLGIEVNSCDGTVSMEVSYSQDFSNPTKVLATKGEIWHSMLFNRWSKIYIRIFGVERKHDPNDFKHKNEAAYTIKTVILKKEQKTKSHIFAAGNDGELDYTHQADGKYVIQFSPIVIVDPDVKNAAEFDFHYTILSSTNRQNLQHQARCGDFYASAHGKKSEWSTESTCPHNADSCSVTVNSSAIDMNIKEHFVTVTGWAVHKETKTASHVSYQVIEFYVEPSLFRSIIKTPWWAKFLAIIVVLLVVVVVFLMRRASILKKKLDYEMNDVRNVAGGMPSIPGVSNRTGLVEEMHEMQERT